jgi:DNA polymerase-1
MLNPAKDDEVYTPAKVVEFMGVQPRQVADLLALRGDAVDNIPGAPGIGDKGAVDLVSRFGSVEAAMDRAAEVERKAYRESLQNHRAQIELSKRLATIATDVPLDWSLDQVAARQPDEESLRHIYTELEFFSQLREMKLDRPAAAVESVSLDDEASLQAWLARSTGPMAVTVAIEGEGLLAQVRMGLSAREGEGAGVPPELFAAMRDVLADPARPKVAHDAKSLAMDLSRDGLDLVGLRDDTMLYGFLLTADPGACGLDALCNRFLRRPQGASVEEQASLIWRLGAQLRDEIDTRGFRRLYEDIDLPLVPVLARMERNGVRVDPSALRAISGQLEAEIERLSTEIQGMAGHPFNVNSPQQLGKVLFEEMKLQVPGKGKSKQTSTAADVLEALAEEHEIAARAIEYRTFAKLKNTYVDALPLLVRQDTGRLHTSFNQAGSATGRVSSSNPNLQNIPVRTELGRSIRAAFVPQEGWKLVVADYSQIELRLLAHMSEDPLLVDAFRRGEDVHARTASEVFGVMPSLVTPDLRRAAKAVNFGIIYGLSGFGLARQLGIPRGQADRYIKGYFERYGGVKRFLDDTTAQVRQSGSTRTLFGRERPIPDINSRNPNARGFAERTAVNTPLQGSAADLIKVAMIRIHQRLADGWESRMLIQVHDELVFEAPVGEIDGLRAIVKREMESVADLKVPLVVDTGVGDNWRDAK